MWGCIQLLNLLHMSVTQAAFQSVQVSPEKIGSSFRAAVDLSVRAESQRYAVLQILAIVVLAIFVFGYPLLLTLFLYRRYRQLTTPARAFQFWKLSGGYRLHSYGFLRDNFVMGRKFA
eukprot:gb/GECG01003995.1/.p1 GENE.gb/GECG01003995.1/~~gb/GECG01003995.1/.p1  ORF type:complete len:118 (+),score=9.45 gb/GECG01003995.1/:1-354(+)